MGSTIRSKVDQMLEITYYDGTKRHSSFEKYAETLQRAFVDLQSTQEVSEERNVCVLLNGISDPRLEAAKNHVIASDHLQSTLRWRGPCLSVWAHSYPSFHDHQAQSLPR